MKKWLSKISRRLAIRRNLALLPSLVAHPTLAEIRTLPASLPQAKVFLVGGSVRDFLLGGVAKDFDVCVTGCTPAEVEKFLLSFPGAKAVFAGTTFPVFKFSVSKSENEKRVELDVALARTERSTGGGSLQDFTTHSDPSVTIQDDLSRRDFTWNAIALNLADATLVDPFNGLEDLKDGIVRTVGNPLDRFTEDRTRALRGLRFAAKLDFSISSETWSAIKTFAPKMNETVPNANNAKTEDFILKRELAGREFIKSLDANPVRTLELWDESGMFLSLMPEVETMKHVLQRPDFHPEGDVFIHTKLALACLPKTASINSKLAVFFHDFGKITKFQVYDRKTKKEIALTQTPQEFCATTYNPMLHLIKNIDHETDSAKMADDVIRRLALTASGIDTELINYLVKEHMFHGLLHWKLSKIEKILFTKTGEPIWELYEMARADACGSHNNMEYAKTVKRYINNLLALREEAAKQPPQLIDGNDVMQELNLKPGPKIKEMLELVREKQLDALAKGKQFTKVDALALIKQNAK